MPRIRGASTFERAPGGRAQVARYPRDVLAILEVRVGDERVDVAMRSTRCRLRWHNRDGLVLAKEGGWRHRFAHGAEHLIMTRNRSISIDYDGGRFHVFEPVGMQLDGEPIDRRLLSTEWRDGATLTFDALAGASLTLRRVHPVPPATLVCPECQRGVTPLRILYGYPADWSSLAVERGLVSLGGCEPGPDSLSCPACGAAFHSDADVLLPSLDEVHLEWLRAGDARRGVLVFTFDDGTRQLFADDREVIAGRGRGGHLVLDGSAVEACHARFVYSEAGELWVSDLCTYHGTYLNGARIQGPTRFREGDEIRIGTHRMRVRRYPSGQAAIAEVAHSRNTP